MIEFLDKKLCCNTTIGDLFKLFIPVGWTFTAFCAILAYLLAPLGRGDSPRWGTVAVVSVSLFTGIGASAAVYSFHRATSSSSIEWTDNDQTETRRWWLNFHSALSAAFIVLSLVMVIFFATVATGINACAHETCGADVSWSLIALVVGAVWLAVTVFGHIQLRIRTLPTSSADRGEVDKVDEAVVQEMTEMA